MSAFKLLSFGFAVFDYILYLAVKNGAKIIDFLCRYPSAFFDAIDCGAADPVFIDQRICRFTFKPESLPKWFVTDHSHHRFDDKM